MFIWPSFFYLGLAERKTYAPIVAIVAGPAIPQQPLGEVLNFEHTSALFRDENGKKIKNTHIDISGDCKVDRKSSYVLLSYVEYARSMGVDVVVLPYFSDDNEISRILSNVNGIIWPGGEGNPSLPTEFTQWATKVMRIAINKEIPQLGICLGHEILMLNSELLYDDVKSSTGLLKKRKVYSNVDSKIVNSDVYSVDKTLILDTFSAEGTILKQKFECHVGSRVCKDLITNHNSLTTNIIVGNAKGIHYHEFGVSVPSSNNIINIVWEIIFTSKDKLGREFISFAKAKHHPITSVQFHPEKPIFELEFNKLEPADVKTQYNIELGKYIATVFYSDVMIHKESQKNLKIDPDFIWNNHPDLRGTLCTEYFNRSRTKLLTFDPEA